MPKRIKQVKHYSQRKHLKKARSANKKFNNEDSNIPSLSIIDTNTIDSATINTTIATQTENIVNTIATQTESTINTVATQTENIVNTVATQTEFFVNTVATQTEVITIQSNEIQVDQTNKLNSKVQLLNLFNQITQILTYNQKYNSKLLQIQQTFLNYIIQTDYNELVLAFSLIQTMRYKKGQNTGKIFSKYLQQKAANHVENSFYQTEHDINECSITIKSLEDQINSLTQQLDKIKSENKSLNGKIGKFKQIQKQQISKTKSYTKEELKTAIKQQLMENKYQYTAKTIQMATKVCQIGKMSYRSAVECTKAVVEWLIDEEPDKWFSVSTLTGWHRDVAKIYSNQQSNIIGNSKFSVYGIMADESKRGDSKIFIICFIYWNSNTNIPQATLLEMKDLSNCSGSTIANIVAETCNTYKIDSKKCFTWVTDNTAYMSGYKSGAVVLFNNKTLSNSFRISCGMHSAHIMITHFENSAFGKLDVNTGYSNQKHPFNLLHLIWQLHNGYDESKKENPMSMKASFISNMYQNLLGFQYTKFQKPLRQRWLYELHAARQFIERYESIEIFAKWFIEKLKTFNNSPKQYISKWELLNSWLKDPLLKIQIKCLVKFGETIYEPMMNFLAGFDSTPRILKENNEATTLPPGRRAHEMPDAVTQWIDDLKNIINNIYLFFEDELLNGINSLNNTEFQILVDGLTSGVEAALESLEKWLKIWLQLPLNICRLGGDNGHEFALAYAKVILKITWDHNITAKEELYIKELEAEIDLKTEFQDFGLHEALEDPILLNEFIEFANSKTKPVYKYPLLYEFVKHRIYYIIVHQQQIEGLFNKFDLKCHPNMTEETKKSKLCLATANMKEISFSKEDLSIAWNQLNNTTSNSSTNLTQYGKVAADKLFDELFRKKS